MIEYIRIWSPEIALERGSMFELPMGEKKKAVKRLKEVDKKWGYDCEKQYHYLNNYDNDDYIFLADLLQDMCNIHKLIYFDPYRQEWIRGCSPIPYIHFEFIEQDVRKRDKNGELLKDTDGKFIPDDTKLNIGVKAPSFNGTHKLVFNYYWLGQYLKFLRNIFDDNEELIVSPDTETEIKKMKPIYGTKEDVLLLADNMGENGLKQQAEFLRIYAASSLEKTKIQIPVLIIIEEDGVQKHIGWGIIDERRNAVILDIKKSIYNTSGFVGFFHERNKLIKDIFISSIAMILGHEVAHVARGHWNLRIKKPEYSKKRNVMMNCEINADWTSMKWLLNELLYKTINKDPMNPTLAYTREELIYLWSVRIFAVYLALSWGYREEDRIWTTQTVEKFKEDRKATHPIYQFRVACVLNHAQEHITHMGNQCEKPDHALFTSDGIRLDRTLFQEVWDNSLNMIQSFEVGLRTSWGKDSRTTLRKLNESLYVERRTQAEDIHKVPFMIAYQEQAQEEVRGIEKEWPVIKEQLRQSGMYFPLDM